MSLTNKQESNSLYARLNLDGRIELDKILAFIILIFSLCSTIWLYIDIKQSIYVIGSILVSISCIIYLRPRRFMHKNPFVTRTQSSLRFDLFINIVFVVLFVGSIIFFYHRDNLYIRPLSYFIVTILMATTVGIEILVSSLGRNHFKSILFKIILIGLSLRWSQVLLFPSIVGADPWVHQKIVNELLYTGYISDWHNYSKMPLMHLVVGITSLITGLNYKFASLVSITTIQVICDTLFIFLLTRLSFGKRFGVANQIGMLAALLLCTANHHVYMGYIGIPNTISATLILPIIYILFAKQEAPQKYIVLILLLMVTIILTHAISTMCLIILLVSFVISYYVYFLFYKNERKLYFVNITILFSVFTFTWWLYVSGHIKIFSGMLKRMFINTSLDLGTFIVSAQAPFSEQLFSYMGIMLFFALSFIGLFYMISKYGNVYTFMLAVGSMVIFGITAFSLFGGKSDVIIAHRWIYYSQILLAIPLAVALLYNYNMFHKNLKMLGSIILLFSLCFFLIISPQVNMENRTFCPSGLARYSFTESELQCIETITDIWNGEKIASDYYYQKALLPYTGIFEFNDLTDVFVEKKIYDYRETVVIIREEIIYHPFWTSKYGVVKLDYDLRTTLNQKILSSIYDCGTVNASIACY